MSDPLADPRAIDLLAAEPDEAGALAGLFRTAATESSETAVGLAAAQHDGLWTGRAANAFRRAIGLLPGRLRGLGAGLVEVAHALAAYEAMLAEIQPLFVQAIAALESARYRLPGLEMAQAQADGALLAAVETPGSGVAHVTALELAAARADGAVNVCQGEIRHLRKRAYELLDEFAAARESCREAIVAAQHGAPVQPPSGSGITVVDVADTCLGAAS
jgi:hypothetical protein